LGGLTLQKTQQKFNLNSQVCLELSLADEDLKKCQGFETFEKAFLLINTTSADSPRVLHDLKEIEGISEVYPLKGMYDILAVTQAESFDKLKETVFPRIRGIQNIKTTLTLTLIKDQEFANQLHDANAFRD
jgi:DNA-binding Lrp family transcriptional regulator